MSFLEKQTSLSASLWRSSVPVTIRTSPDLQSVSHGSRIESCPIWLNDTTMINEAIVRTRKRKCAREHDTNAQQRFDDLDQRVRHFHKFHPTFYCSTNDFQHLYLFGRFAERVDFFSERNSSTVSKQGKCPSRLKSCLKERQSGGKVIDSQN